MRAGGTAWALPRGDLADQRANPAAKRRRAQVLGPPPGEGGIEATTVRLPIINRDASKPRGGPGRTSDQLRDRRVPARLAASKCDHGRGRRRAASMGTIPEILITRKERRAAPAIVVANDVVGLPAEELHRASATPRASSSALRRSPPAAGWTANKRRPRGRCACKGTVARDNQVSQHAISRHPRECKNSTSTGGWITRPSRR